MSEFISYYFKRLIRILIDTFCSIIGLLYPQNRNYLPPITDAILLDSAINISNKIKDGKLKSEDVVKVFIKRMKEVQPHINGLIQDRFEEAIKEAKAIDQKVHNELSGYGFTDGQSIHTQPFLGVPFTIKDSIAVKDMYFTAGSIKRKGITADDDSPSVAYMRKAGAIPIGMTNTPEMLFWWAVDNKLYGRTDNPYDKSRITGGSSGGEAATLASAASVIGIGSDGGGSLRIPACFCGIFGHKTTPGIISLKGHWPPRGPPRTHMMSYGPMCRYASDLKTLLRVMAGDRVSQLKLDHNVDISKLNVYYVDDYNGDPLITQLTPEMRQIIKKTLKFLAQSGAKLTKVKLDKFDHSFSIWYNMWKSTDDPKLGEELTNRNGRINPWYELIKCIFGYSDHTLAAIVASISELWEPTKEYREKYIKLGKEFTDEIHKLLGDDGILIYPSHPETAPKRNVTLFKFKNIAYHAIFNSLNVAVTQVPMGLGNNGLPIGLQVIAGPYNDHLTIAVAEELEKNFGGWTPPSRIIC